jgi:hypothetical protein
MKFSNKYPNLGNTERIRVPTILVSHVESLLEEYNRISGNHNIEFLARVQTRILEGLETID